jgi:hypothetical protein
MQATVRAALNQRVRKGTLCVNVKDLGAKGNGLRDDTVAIQRAINRVARRGGGIVFFPEGTYRITDTLLIEDDDVVLLGAPGAELDATGMPNQVTLSSQFAIQALGTQGSNVTITSDLAAGDDTVVVTSTSGFAAGDMVLITSDEKYADGASAGGDRGALYRIESITDATTLVLTEPSWFSHAAASSARIRTITPVRGFGVDNLTLRGGGEDDLDHCGIQVRYAEEPILRNVTAHRFRDTAIQFRTVWGGIIDRPITRDGIHTVAGQTGYGVSVVDGSRHTQVLYPEASNSRHAVTGGGNPVSIHVNVVQGVAIDMRAAAFDCHEECWWWTFDHCEAYGGDDAGFGIRGQETTLISPKSHRAGNHGIHVKNYDTVTSGLRGPMIINPDIRDSADSNILWEGTTDCRILGGGIFGGSLRGANSGNNVTVWRSDDVTIAADEYDGATGSGGDGNNVRLVGASSSDRCTNVVIRPGTFRNAVARWLKADFTDALTFDSPYVVHSPTTASYLTSCTRVRKVGEMTGPAAPVTTATTNSDSDVTLTTLASSPIRRHNGTLTADRTVTLSANNAHAGARFRIIRTGGGAFNLNVGTGPLKALATNQWCDVEHDGTNWVLTAFGSL